MEKFENANSAIEDMIYAPGTAGAGRKAKQQVGASNPAAAAAMCRVRPAATRHGGRGLADDE